MLLRLCLIKIWGIQKTLHFRISLLHFLTLHIMWKVGIVHFLAIMMNKFCCSAVLHLFQSCRRSKGKEKSSGCRLLLGGSKDSTNIIISNFPISLLGLGPKGSFRYLFVDMIRYENASTYNTMGYALCYWCFLLRMRNNAVVSGWNHQPNLNNPTFWQIEIPFWIKLWIGCTFILSLQIQQVGQN